MTSSTTSTAPRRRRADSPSAAEVTALRESCGISKDEAAGMARTTWRSWQQWETGERAMHPAVWDIVQARMLLAAGRMPEALQVLTAARRAPGRRTDGTSPVPTQPLDAA